MSALNKIFKFCLTQKRLFIILLFFIFSLTPFFWYQNVSQYNFLGGGDYPLVINAVEQFLDLIFTYNPFVHGGMNSSFATALLFPFLAFYIFFGLFKLTPFVISLLSVSSIIFLSQISFFYFIEYVFRYKLNSTLKNTTIFSFFGAILYGFSPYMVALLSPGHWLMLISYAVFPLILKYFDTFLVSKKINIKSAIYLFFLFLFCASNFANVGALGVVLLILFIYVVLLAVTKFINIARAISRFSIVIILILISNSWWLFPFVSDIQGTIARGEASVITKSLGVAVKYANIKSIFLGRASTLLYWDLLPNDYYLSFTMLMIFLVVLLFFSVAVFQIKKYKYLLILLSLSVFAIFVTKGSQPPFSGIFMWLYNNVPGFQIFRRPVSKFYWFFLFTYISLAVIGMAILADKIKRRRKIKILLLFFIPIFIMSGYLIYIFSKTPTIYMKPFNIPIFNYQANDYLLKDGVSRVLILPGFINAKPHYDKSLNFYKGVDFLGLIWKFPLIIPDIALEGRLYKKPTNQLIQLIRENKSICKSAKNLGISHIVVRQNIRKDASIKDQPDALIGILNKHQDVREKREFGTEACRGFAVYELKDECRGNLVQTDNFSSLMDYQMINPVEVAVKFSNVHSKTAVHYLVNFNNDWKVFLKKYSYNQPTGYNFVNKNTYYGNRIFFEGEELSYLWKKPVFDNTHKIVNDYANGWTIDPKYIKQNYPKEYYKENPDGSIDVKLVLYFKPQSYFYLGLFISGLTLLGCLGYLGYDWRRRRGY